jgi:hypothetical protein
MSIQPVSGLNIAASIAGTDRAASTEVVAGQNKGRGTTGGVSVADAIVDPTEKVSKSELSGDSDADGRQMLDTFEQQNHDPSEQQDQGDAGHHPPDSKSGLIINRPTLGGHIDLCG